MLDSMWNNFRRKVALNARYLYSNYRMKLKKYKAESVRRSAL